MAAVTERENSERVEEPTLLKLIKHTSEACTVKKLPFSASHSGTMLDLSLHYPKVEGLSLATAASTRRDNGDKNS